MAKYSKEYKLKIVKAYDSFKFCTSETCGNDWSLGSFGEQIVLLGTFSQVL